MAKKKFEPDEQRGFIFKNSFKTEGDNKPHFTGEAKLEGKLYKVSLWKKLTKKGDPMLSLTFTPSAESKKYSAAPGQKIEEDDLPF